MTNSAVFQGVLFWILTCSTPAWAFCVHNDTASPLKFEVGDHNIQFTKTVAPDSMSCCDWRRENCNWTRTAWGKLSVRVTAPNGTAEECTTRMRADGYLRLRHFEPAACIWKH